MRSVILEGHIPEDDVRTFRNLPYPLLVVRLLVLPVVDLTEPLERYGSVLRLLYERDELQDRGVQLADDVLEGCHHTEGHVSLYHGARGEKRYDNVLGLVNESAAYLLCLSEGQALHAHLEQPGLDALPLPALLLLASAQLDVLHAVYQLHDAALVGRRLLETHVVQLAPAFQEEYYPCDVQGASEDEHPEDAHVIACHDDAVYHQ